MKNTKNKKARHYGKCAQHPLPLCLPFYLSLCLLLLSACVSTSGTGVERIASDEVYDLTGKWNDIDSQEVADKMVDSMLSARWLTNWSDSDLPVVIVGEVSNNTSEHIDIQLFAKDLEAELINSGEIAFVASSLERGQVRDEREDQQSNSSELTMKRIAQETGADYMLIGNIGSSVEETSGLKVVYYLVSMELINVESNIKAWIGTKRIKKLINKNTQSQKRSEERLRTDW